MDVIKNSRKQKRRTRRIKANGQGTESPGLDSVESPLIDEDGDEQLMLND